jgi:hypothetical protein
LLCGGLTLWMVVLVMYGIDLTCGLVRGGEGEATGMDGWERVLFLFILTQWRL